MLLNCTWGCESSRDPLSTITLGSVQGEAEWGAKELPRGIWRAEFRAWLCTLPRRGAHAHGALAVLLSTPPLCRPEATAVTGPPVPRLVLGWPRLRAFAHAVASA